jgi:hypothetical protein
VIKVLQTCHDHMPCMFTCFDINVVKICTFCHENFKKRKHGNMGVTNEIGPSQVLWLDLVLGHHGMSPSCIEMACR